AQLHEGAWLFADPLDPLASSDQTATYRVLCAPVLQSVNILQRKLPFQIPSSDELLRKSMHHKKRHTARDSSGNSGSRLPLFHHEPQETQWIDRWNPHPRSAKSHRNNKGKVNL